VGCLPESTPVTVLVTVPTAVPVTSPTAVLVTAPTGVVAAPTAVVALPAVALTLAVAGAFTARSEGLVPADASDPCEENVPDPDCRGAAHEGLPDP
jgi:hypothetical protein